MPFFGGRSSFMPGETAGTPEDMWRKFFPNGITPDIIPAIQAQRPDIFGSMIADNVDKLTPQQPYYEGFFGRTPDEDGRTSANRAELLFAGLQDVADRLSGGPGGNMDASRKSIDAQIAGSKRKQLAQALQAARAPDGSYDMQKVRNLVADFAAGRGDAETLLSMAPKPEEYDATPRTVLDPVSGKPILIQTSKTGATKQLPYGAVDTDLLSPEALAQKQAIAQSGRSNITMNAGPSFASGIGTGAAGILENGRTQAQSARDTIVQGNGILEALDSGNVVSGPGTTFGMAARQIFGGDQNKLNATRQVIKGLAEITLQSRGLLKGQGQITENEQKTLEKAKSGDIDSLSTDEIRTIVKANERLGRAQISQYQQTLSRAKNTGVTPDVLSLYQIEDAPQYAPKAKSGPAGSSGGVGWRIVP